MEPIPNSLEIATRRPCAPLIRRGKQFWQQPVRDHETSGLSMSQFCLERGLAKATFLLRRKALKQQTPRYPSNSASLMWRSVTIALIVSSESSPSALRVVAG